MNIFYPFIGFFILLNAINDEQKRVFFMMPISHKELRELKPCLYSHKNDKFYALILPNHFKKNNHSRKYELTCPKLYFSRYSKAILLFR